MTMLKIGESLIDPEGREWVVVERHGNDSLYSVKIAPNGWKLPFGKKAQWLLTADYWVGRGGWRRA